MRLAVHSQEVAERFPNDSIISITTPSELNETKLSSLLNQTSSSTSSKSTDGVATHPYAENRKRGISRDDNGQFVAAATSSTREVDDDNGAQNLTNTEEYQKRTAHLEDKKQYMNRDKSLPAIPNDSSAEPSSTFQSYGDQESNPRGSIEKRQSFQSTRPLIRNSEDGYGYRPKVKLGPRPSLEYSGRPNRANSHSQGVSRLVSTLPAGVRMPVRKAVPTRPQSQQSHSHHNHFGNARDPIVTTTPTMTSPQVNRPSSRSGSIRSISTLSHTPESKPAATALETQRLMKALHIRQRKIAGRIPEETTSVPSTNSPKKDDVPARLVDDEAALHVLDEGSPAEGDPDVVHVGTKDLSDVSSVNLQSSPLSIPEPSDGPSTQASSIADAEESGLVNSSLLDQEHSDPKMLPSRSISGHEDYVLRIPDEAESSDKPSCRDDQAISSVRYEDVQILIPHDVPLPESTEDEEIILGSSPSLVEVPENGQTILGSSLGLVEEPEKASRNVATPIIPPLSIEILNEDASTTEKLTSAAHPTEISRPMDHKAKRRALIDPIQIGLNADNSDDNFLSDDSFMEELQSATLEEAKPISVSRSPITPVFPKSPKSLAESSSSEGKKLLQEPPSLPTEYPSNFLISHVQNTVKGDPPAAIESDLPKAFRSVSNPLDSISLHTERHLSPKSSDVVTRRSASISPTPRERLDLSLPISKKVGVSTGISQRIKALEKFTSSPTSQTLLTPPAVSPAFVNNRKASIGSQPVTSSPAENPANRNFSFRRKFPYPTPSPSPQVSKLIRKPETSAPGDHDPSIIAQPTSISVTAKIIRDVQTQNPDVHTDFSEPSIVKLHHSPLIVEHQTSISAFKKSPTRPTRSRPNSFVSNASSSPEFKRESLADSRRDSSASRRPLASRKGSDADTLNALSESSFNSQESTEGKDEKKTSKRSRLFKRMSSMSSSSRRSIVNAFSPSVKEEESIPENQQPMTSPIPSLSVDLGDLNTQFPDTLVRKPWYFSWL